ncbi:tRNA glutamyl-Q(34) synthetase GluQRS [Pulveribacter suum]|uniref:Glutamyl-Q tRNA(Asp) synthetase n=1 Tax=Pulveribacter suum TaxID=2116657 RepID=A0A2P1NL38_9BURK|nr:tRNA glutamyl-Q(34) synthetase GluQRS [Pulveribacter suum]AVP57764.1 tRNA glutamyl-Q(34) synthetase GluQRS [Pulveribacter suum]
MGYIGRFAPSPTGPLHAGSLVAALASWLDARAAGGRWLVRIEDVDPPRCPAGASERILAQLAACGLHPDAPPLYQSSRADRYQQALDALRARALAYPCACTRRDVDAALAARGLAHERHVERPYPGTCRAGLGGRTARAWRLHTEKYQSNQPAALASQALAAHFSIAKTGVAWHDRRLGVQQQDVAAQVGDFVLRRADGLWSYQLAVVVDDADQGITHVVRGEDLADNTPRQILLQSALGLPTPRYLHTPLVRGADGEKLSKQHGAPAIDERQPLAALAQAASALALPAAPAGATTGEGLALWARAWARTYNPPP